MRTWGLDVSTDPTKTVAVALDWGTDGVAIGEILRDQGPADIVALLKSTDYAVLAADVPFGWPTAFAALVGEHQFGHLAHWSGLPVPAEAETWRKTSAAHRVTDLALREHMRVRRMPLSPSFDRLGATTAMWALIEAWVADDVTIDRSGMYDGATGPWTVETYPAAQLAAWGRRERGKPTWEVLWGLLGEPDVGAHWEGLAGSDDVRDALVCAISARARALGWTEGPEPEHMEAAKREGWIHITLRPLEELIHPAGT
ncbi:MAG TPA: DUF429 domain-containing protein [Dermatophilaceae bacterium]|nr:DUF429 domain-containing protein [Dermatophilaceae bacterium]